MPTAEELLIKSQEIDDSHKNDKKRSKGKWISKIIFIGIIGFCFWFIGCGEDGICNLDGCDRKATGWQYSNSKYMCYRTSVAKESGWGYCKRSHCVDSLR